MATKSTFKKYKAKLYFGCNEDEKHFLTELLIEFKSISGNLKSFNNYTYNNVLYFNLYLTNTINTEREFELITDKFNNLFKKVFHYKYKNEYNTPLFSTKNNNKKEYKKPIEKFQFIDDN